MPIACPACGQPAPDDTDATCPSCATAWTADGVSRFALFAASAGGTPTLVGSVELEGGRLGPYRVVKALGRGAMGTVVLAEPQDGGAPVAIKILTAPGLGTQLARFVREGELLAKLAHPNLVRVLDVRELSGHPCLVCEYLPGGTLRDRLRAEGRLPWREAARVMEQLLAGLAACHARGIVHRDFKPENVLFDASGNAKLADLGVAKHYGAEGPTLTGVGQLIGTPRYMSPEQVRGEPAVLASDLYAAGLVLYELLVGHAPFDGGTVMELLRQHVSAPPPPVPPDVEAPPGVLAMIERALAKRPEDRPPSADDMAQALRAAARGSGRISTPPRSSNPPRAGSGTHGTVARRSPVARLARRAALVAAVAVSGAAATYHLTRPDERPLDPQVTVENGDLRVTWRTRSACRGTVSGEDASGAARVAREDAAVTEHGLALTGLAPAQTYRLAIVTAGGAVAWSHALALPARGRARFVPTAEGAEVRAPACGATAGTLVRETGRGAEPEGPGAREGDELVFRTRAAPLAFAAGSRVEVALAPGVTARWPLEDASALAERLTHGLDTFDPTAAMLKVVLAPEYDPTLETQAVENFLGAKILGNRTYHLKKGLFRQLVQDSIDRQPWRDALADFRPLADDWFAGPAPLEAKRRLYADLLKIEWLDLLILSQHDHDRMGFAEVHRRFLPQTWNTPEEPEGVDRVVLPGELPLLDRTCMFVPKGFVDWMQMRLFLAQESGWRAATGIPADASLMELKNAIPAQRTVHVTLPPVSPGHHRVLRARVARMGPMYALTLILKPTGAPPLEVRLAQSGTAEFLRVMEEPSSGSTRPWAGAAYRYWGEIVTRIPAELLPAGPLEVQLGFQSPPGIALERLTRLVRGVGVREVNISASR